MPVTGSELINQGFRDLGAGARSVGDALARNRDRDDRMAEEERARKAKEELDARLGVAADTLGTVSKKLDDPNFRTEDLLREVTPIMQEGVKTQNPGLIRAADPLFNILKERRAAEAAKEEKTAKKAEKLRKDKREGKKDKFAEAKFKRETNKAHETNPTTRRTRVVGESFNRIKKAVNSAPSGIRDASIVTDYAKSIDPGSVVRPGEFATIKGVRAFVSDVVVGEDGSGTITRDGKTMPVPSFLLAALQSMDPKKGGSFLLPSQRQAILESVTDNYKEQLKLQVPQDELTMRGVEGLGFSPKDIIGGNLSSALLEKMAQEEKEAAEKAEEDLRAEGGTPDLPAEPDGLTFIDEAKRQEVIAANPAVMQRIQQVNQENLAQGKPELTEAEIQAIEDSLLAKLKYKVKRN